MNDPQGLVLLGTATDETRLLVHRPSGFSLPIPGRPVQADVAAAGEPTYHGLATMTDLPVEIGVRVDELPSSGDPQELAMSLTLAYATSRAQDLRRVAALRGRLLGQGFHGGANTIYVIRNPDPPTRMEHIEVHTRRDGTRTWAVYVTTRWAPSEVDVVRWAHLRTALGGQAHWGGDAPRTEPPRLWPAQSRFAELDARLQLLPEALTDAEAMSQALGEISDDEATDVIDMLINTANADDPPTAEVSEALMQAYCGRISVRAPTAAGETLMRNTPAVRTFHDLRAWCWQAIYAISHRPGQPDRSRLN